MATSVLGLPDAEIDKLLAEAEARLAGNGGSEQNAIVTAPAAAEAQTVATPPQPPAGVPTAVSKDEKLSVRVPQLAEKKKAKDTLSDWYSLPRTNLTPELKRDLQALKMRDVIAMGKQFFKKDGKKSFVPEYSQVGTIIAGATDGTNNRLTRKEQKKTIVAEVLSADTGKYKNKFHEIQKKKQSGGKVHYRKMLAARKRK